MVSIIVPVYNAEKYLEQMIRSVLNQSYNDFELILVNDGSKDESGIICDKFSKTDERIRVIHKENGGVSSARNAGLEIAKGEWLCFYDADDIIPPDALRLLTDAAEKYNVDIVLGNYVEVNGEKKIPFKSGLEYDTFFNRNEVINKLLIGSITSSGYFGSCCVKIYRRKIFEDFDIRFPSRRRAEDWLVNIKYLEHAESAVAIRDYVYYYCRHGESAMSQFFPEQFTIWEENELIKKKLIEEHRYPITDNQLAKSYIEKYLWYIFSMLLANSISKSEMFDKFKRRQFLDYAVCCDSADLNRRFRGVVNAIKKNKFSLAFRILKLMKYGYRIKCRIKGTL